MSPEVDRKSHEPEPLGGLRKAEESDRTPPRVHRRTMTRIGIGMLGLFLILLAVGLFPRARNRRELAVASQKAQNAVREVYVVRPEPAAAVGLSLAATTQAIQDAIVYARTSGYLVKRHVDIGDHVTAGQLMAEIDSPEIDQQLRQAKSDLQQSKRTLDLQKANLDLARSTTARYQAADKERAVAKEALDQSVATYRTAGAAVAAAQANVESNEANVQRLEELTSFERVVAPFDGTVIQRSVDVGALITAGSPTNNTAVAPSSVNGGANGLFEVAQIDTLRVFVNVPQAYAPNVKVGLPVQVTARGHLTQPMTGTVTRTANALDPVTRTLLTEIDIPNQSQKLLPGMFVYANLTIAPSGTRWRIPATALVFDAQGTRVAIVGADNRLHFQEVVLGRDFGDSIDVQAGLQGSESIVKQPRVSLQEGQLIAPIEAQKRPGG